VEGAISAIRLLIEAILSFKVPSQTNTREIAFSFDKKLD
jgi:hypothetical protein